MKIATIVGSISQHSLNMKIAKFMQKRYKEKLTLEIMPLDHVPIFNRDIELTPPEIIRRYREIIKSAEGALFFCPEYNHSIPGVLKNALDWFSRVENVYIGKPAMIVGATPGMLGTIRAQVHLREVLNSGAIAVNLLPQNEVFIANALEKIDEEGNITDEGTLKFLDKTVENFIQHIIRSQN